MYACMQCMSGLLPACLAGWQVGRSYVLYVLLCVWMSLCPDVFISLFVCGSVGTYGRMGGGRYIQILWLHSRHLKRSLRDATC